ncbi:TolC family protein (plasmid) [Pseudoalteromonas xiamenensis]|uniref:TolC family protein n=1 Tax=Pseudoalteromonas xiamenensis TaxID=882626 RepID=UPI0027E46427|nr:TolC family protein [Pseudoalteromonas xiamenensis]WMN61839.1 TolC family protein [Pseudoalteromonas xiamenensis]
MKIYTKTLSTLALLLSNVIVCTNALAQNTLTLEQAIELAQQRDLWQQQARFQSKALDAREIAAGSLPDPSINFSLMNLPMDSFSFNQEAMTQAKVGVAQMFPRGDSLNIAQRKVALERNQLDWQQANRYNQIALLVSELWLDGVAADGAILLIEKNKQLFEQLMEVTKASYASALGKVRQQDVIRAELELLQLEERLASEQQKRANIHARLTSLIQRNDFTFEDVKFDFSVLPALKLGERIKTKSQEELLSLLTVHPTIKALQTQELTVAQDIELAKQNYKPQWGVNASYGYRDDADNGMNRADFFSVGVSFDLPIFTSNRQDQQLQAAQSQAEATKTATQLTIKSLLGQTYAEISNLERLFERQTRYKSQLEKQSSEQAEATLTAYTHDDGNFTDVVWARVNVLNIQLASLNIDIQALKSVAKLNALLQPNLGQYQGAPQ